MQFVDRNQLLPSNYLIESLKIGAADNWFPYSLILQTSYNFIITGKQTCVSLKLHIKTIQSKALQRTESGIVVMLISIDNKFWPELDQCVINCEAMAIKEQIQLQTVELFL